MKILLFTLEYPPFKGGVSNYYENIVKFWPNQNEIFVLNNNNGELINDKLPILKWLPAVWQLWRAVKCPLDKGGKGDFHILAGHILPLGTAALIVKKIKGVNYSVILHGMDLALAIKAGRKKWLAKKILKNASRIICANNFTAKIARDVVGERKAEKVKVVNPGVDTHITHNMLASLRPRSGEHITQLRKKFNLENKIVLFSIGRLVKRKGFDKVIEAMPMILKKVPNLVYVIAGTGPDEEYLRQIAIKCHCEELASGDEAISAKRINRDCFVTLAMTENIIFLGKISDEEKWAWLGLCDIFTMPSRQINDDFEGFGIVYLEASLMGKPIVAGRSGGVEDAVVDNETGSLVNPEDTKEIAEAIIKLAKDEGLRKKLGERGRKRAEEEFDWQGQVNRIYSIIKKAPFI